jgi:dienelactone hydrolase
MHFTSDTHLADGTREQRFTLDGTPGILWNHNEGPVVLLAHPGDLDRMYPRLRQRAKAATQAGFTAAALELPGAGTRPKIEALEQARTELRTAIHAGEPVPDDVVDRLVLPLVDATVPEQRALLDALGATTAAYTGGIIAIGVRMARVEPRVQAAVLFAGSFVPRATLEEARKVTIPLHVLLQWDDESNDRGASLALFDAFGSAEKRLDANLGGHAGVPDHAGEAATAFLTRHLR